MPEFTYTWKKVYAVQTGAQNTVQPGDDIVVQDRNGGSKQRVLSVTTQRTRDGVEYKTLLLEAM